MTTNTDKLAAQICRDVAELPDRNSPEDWPEAMLVTHDELQAIVTEALSAAGRVQQAGVAPAGFVLVPAKIDIDMQVAFCETWFSAIRCIDDPEMQDAWAAALAAAPSQSAVQPDHIADTSKLVSAVQPLSEAQRVPLDEWRVMKMAKDAGFNLEPTANMLYTVRGNAAQVINMVHAVEAAHGIVTKEGT